MLENTKQYNLSFRKVRVVLIGCTILLSYLLWFLVDSRYLTFLFTKGGWDTIGDISLHARDFALSITMSILIVLSTFGYTDLVLSIEKNISRTFYSMLYRRLTLLCLNALTAVVLTYITDNIIPWESTMPFSNGILVYTIASTFCSDIYLTLKYNATVRLSTEAEAVLKIQKLEAERQIVSEKLSKIALQVDNHFMFNSLATLGVLIDQNPVSAREFCDSLTDCYRYLVLSTKHPLVTLKEEMAFLERYLTMMLYRFPNAIRIDTSVSNLTYQIPPLTIQGLIENAIKHNAMTKDKPLIIEIKEENGCIKVSNEIIPTLGDVPSTGFGLDAVRERYRPYGKEISTSQYKEKFIVTVPLL